MTGPDLTAIAAVASNGVIGRGTDIPWRIPEDWARFKKVTMGGVYLCGRTTHEAMGALPGRQAIVLTSRDLAESDSVLRAGSKAEALALLGRFPDRRWFVAGGAHIYTLFWDVTTELDVTLVDQAPHGDAYFPVIDPDDWVETARTPRDGFAFVTYRRTGPQAASALASAVAGTA